MIGKIVKWSAATPCAAYIGYANAHKIDHALREIKYATVEAENPFVPKDQALDLRIVYQRNLRGNLETYFVSFDQKLPIYKRAQGLVLGDSTYNWANLTEQERKAGCKSGDVTKDEKKASTRTLPGTLERLFEIFTSKE